LKHGKEAAAFPRECGSQIGILRYLQNLCTRLAAGQGTRTRTARFAAVMNSAIACALNARLTDAISLQLNVQVNAAVAAGFD
jgi:hypothetical protein